MSTHTAKTQRALDPVALRADFPILAQEVRVGKPLIYLDNAATTQKPQVVLDVLNSYYREINANVHRAIHRLGELATAAYEEARVKVAAFINAPSERSVIFTRGTTESINLVAHSWGDRYLRAGDEILISEMEHHSNIVPWQLVAKRTGAKLKFIPLTSTGELDMDAFHKLLTPSVKILAVAHMSNVLGTINPARDLVRAAHAVGAVVLLDGAQSAPHLPVDMQELDCDFYAFSGHKMCAPTGVGILYARESLLEEMDPFLGGGEMINKVTLTDATWADLPHKFEAGTPNIAGAIGIGAAVDYLKSVGMDAIHAYEQELTSYAIEQLETIPDLQIHGHARERGGAISFSIEGVHPHDVSHFLDRDGIAIRAGHMCAQPLMRVRGVTALSRASPYFYNTREEVDVLAKSLIGVREFFHRANG
ncbi:MAG: cysteine desulfurase [Kiritimatiellae bacterium]|nr:cysteine desulfurase [Kiritimatiellia bacterium]